jgi:hypothetical protein
MEFVRTFREAMVLSFQMAIEWVETICKGMNISRINHSRKR